MKFLNPVLSVVLILPATVFADDNDEWLGLNENRYRLQLNYGLDSDDESVWGMGFAIPMPAYSELFVSWSNYEVVNQGLLNDPNAAEDQQLSDYNFSWHSDPYASWSVEIGHRYRGKSGAVEVTQNQFGLYHAIANWRIGTYYYDGEVTGYRREQIIQRFNIADSASLDREGYGIELSRTGAEWAWQLKYEQLDYSRDLSNVLNSRLFLLNFNDAVLSQVLLLTNWNVAFNLEKQFEHFSLNASVEQYEEVVDEREATLYSTGASFPLSRNIDLGLDYFYFSQDANQFVNLNLVMAW